MEGASDGPFLCELAGRTGQKNWVGQEKTQTLMEKIFQRRRVGEEEKGGGGLAIKSYKRLQIRSLFET